MLRVSLIFVLFFCVLFTGCSYQNFEAKADPSLFYNEDVGLIWPAPPDRPRIKLVRVIQSPSDFKKISV